MPPRTFRSRIISPGTDHVTSWPTLVFSTCHFYPASRRILQPLHFHSLLENPPVSFSPFFLSFSFSVGVRARTRPAYQFLSLRGVFTRSRLVGASGKGIPGPPSQKWKHWVGKVGCNQARARTLRVLRPVFSRSALSSQTPVATRTPPYPPSPKSKKSRAEATTVKGTVFPPFLRLSFSLRLFLSFGFSEIAIDRRCEKGVKLARCTLPGLAFTIVPSYIRFDEDAV